LTEANGATEAWPTLRDLIQLALGGGIGSVIGAILAVRRDKREETESVFSSYDADIEKFSAISLGAS
jgi:hypothetical protein